MNEVRCHADRHSPPLTFPVNCCGQDPVAKGHQHTAVDDAMGIAMTLEGAKTVGKAVFGNLVEIGPVVGGEGPPAGTQLEPLGCPGCGNSLFIVAHVIVPDAELLLLTCHLRRFAGLGRYRMALFQIAEEVVVHNIAHSDAKHPRLPAIQFQNA